VGESPKVQTNNKFSKGVINLKRTKSLFLLITALVMTVSLVYAPSAQEKGGTLTIANPADITGLDPAFITDAATDRVADRIYNHLAAVDQEGKLQPELAKSWDVSEDLTTYTFYLREDVTFHDGTKFNAEAVKAQLDRVLDPDVASVAREQFKKIIDSYEILDEYTIRIKTKRPHVTFIKKFMLANPMAIPSPTAFEKYGEDFAWNPVGTGPFVFEEYEAGQHVKLSKNEDYWQGAPKLDEIVYKPIPEVSTRLVELETGGVDLVYKVPLEDLDRLEKNKDIVIQKTPYPSIEGLWFQHDNYEPFGNVEVRRALAHGLDEKKIYESLLKGVAMFGNSFIPVVSWANYDTGHYKYAPEKAKSILEEAGWTHEDGDGVREKDGKELSFTITTTPAVFIKAPEICAVAQSQWKAIGVEAEIETLDWSAFLDKQYGKKFDMIFTGWQSGSQEPTNFAMNNVGTGGKGNAWGYSNLAVDAILQRATEIKDREARKELYKEAQKITHRDVVWIPIYNQIGMAAHTDKLEGYEYSAIVEDFTKAWIED